MRIRIIQRPTIDCIDGIRLDHFAPGRQYDVGARLAELFLAERWAEPVSADEPALVIPVSELEQNRAHAGPSNLVREIYPPYYDGPAAFAADRRSIRRSRRPVS